MLLAFFTVGIGFLLAAAVAGVVALVAGGTWAQWLALHLALLGGVSQLVLGAGQFFVAAFLATEPPSKRLVAAQLATWNVGTLCIAVGVPSGRSAIVDAGGALILVALGLFAAALWRMERSSLQRARWAVRWYYACAVCLALGALAGVLLTNGAPFQRLLGAHLALNLAGWLGTAIVGTLHTFFPSLTHTRLRFERLQGPTFCAWLLGVAALAAGYGFDVGALAAAGWLALTTGAALLAANLLASAHAARRDLLGLPARLVAVGQVFLVAGLLVALAAIAADGALAPFTAPYRAVLATLWLAGWIGLTVSGSLLHLLTVLQRVRRLSSAMPMPRPARDRLVAGVAAVAVAALALSRVPALEPLADPAAAAVLAVAAVLGARIVALAARAVLAARATRRAKARPTAAQHP